MSNYVWLCNYGSYYVAETYGIVIQTKDYDGVKHFVLKQKRANKIITDDELKDLENLIAESKKIWQPYGNYEFISSQKMPIKLFKEPDVDHYLNTPKKEDVFFRITNGYLVINKKLYDVISQLHLGKTHFSQVYIYDIETKEQLLDEPYYFVNIAEKYQFFDNQNSLGVRRSMYSPGDPVRFILSPKNDDIIVAKEALTVGVNMWHDPLLNNSLFFSDELAQALFKAGFTQKELGLVRCQTK